MIFQTCSKTKVTKTRIKRSCVSQSVKLTEHDVDIIFMEYITKTILVK